MQRALLLCIAIIFPTFAISQSATNSGCSTTKLRFEVSFSTQQSQKPLDGRVYVMLSTNNDKEPRFQISDEPDSQQFFGMDVDGLAAGKALVVDQQAVGYPALNLGCIPAGDYYVQGLLNIYQTYHLANGHTVKLPPEKGEGQQW